MIGRRLGISLAVASFVLFAIGVVCRGRAARQPGEGAGLEEVRGPAERVPGDAVGLDDRLRQLRGGARERRRSSTSCSTTKGSRAEHRSSPTCTSASAASTGASRSSSAVRRRTRPSPARTSRATSRATSRRPNVIGPNGQGIEPGSFGEILRAMQAGHSYANIHTTRWPGGEIRGQINDKDQKEFDK